MAQFDYDSAYDPAAPVIPIGLANPDDDRPPLRTQALIDSGSDATLIPLTILQRIGTYSGEQVSFRGVTGSRMITDMYRVLIYMPIGISYGIRAIATRGTDEIILGRDVLNQWRIVLDGPGEIVEITA
ncbi:MAG: hypothetical protein KJZ86_08345 [Caldilineaceae bacterium]|nr:hypothetical protein [Caldilineaceae bacterium]HRJ40809.1 hypothetical protein [Caldilineaceae bacterium]